MKADTAFLIELGRHLRRRRFEQNLTTQEAAALCGISSSYYNYIERGMRSRLTIETMFSVIDHMGLELDITIKSKQLYNKPDPPHIWRGPAHY